MTRSVDDTVLDAALDEIATGTQISVCDTEPTTVAEANTTYMLAATAMTAGDGNGDYVVAEGDVSGRKVSVSQQTDVAITNTGTAAHVAIYTGSVLLFVTTCTAQGLTAAGTVTIPEWDIEIQDPEAP